MNNNCSFHDVTSDVDRSVSIVHEESSSGMIRAPQAFNEVCRTRSGPDNEVRLR